MGRGVGCEVGSVLGREVGRGVGSGVKIGVVVGDPVLGYDDATGVGVTCGNGSERAPMARSRRATAVQRMAQRGLNRLGRRRSSTLRAQIVEQFVHTCARC